MNNDINKEIGLRIKKLREDKGEYQKETADNISKLGIPLSDSQLGLYEIGLRKVPNSVLVGLAHYFNVSTDYILTGKKAIDAPVEIAASTEDHIDIADLPESAKEFIKDIINKYKNLED